MWNGIGAERSKLLALAARLHVNCGTDVFWLDDKPCRHIAPKHRERGRPLATRCSVIAVYLLRSAQYQFCNCGVLCAYACRGRLALNQLWNRGGQHG
jgi:hypothetical protein